MKDVFLTTVDNPYNPFTQFDAWYAFDTQKGYNTCAYLDRILKTSDEISKANQLYALESAIDDIIRINSDSFYKKVYFE